MEKTNILTLIITLVVGVILAGSLLGPVISDATKTEATLENNGYFNLNKITNTDENTHTIGWDVTNPQVIAIDGENVSVSDWGVASYQQLTIFATESDLIRVNPVSQGQSISWVQIRGNQVNYAQANSNFSATITQGSATISVDSSPWSLTFSEAYMITPGDGEYTMKKSNETAYMLSDSPIISMGFTQLPYSGGSDNVVFGIRGTVDGVDVSVVRHSANTTITTSNLEIHKTEASKYVGVSNFDKITFTASNDGTETDVTYSYVIVPHKITAELSEHLTPGQISLMGAIPVMVIVALLMAAVGAIALRRAD